MGPETYMSQFGMEHMIDLCRDICQPFNMFGNVIDLTNKDSSSDDEEL